MKTNKEHSGVDYLYCILGFARADYLKQLVGQIRNIEPERRILIFIDGDPGFNPRITRANSEARETAAVLGADPLTTILEFPKSNLGTKAALRHLLSEAFKICKNVVYIEDDLRLTENPSQFLQNVFKQLETHDDIAFGNLYTRYDHNLEKKGNYIRLSRWPELWGLIITEDKFRALWTSDVQSKASLKLILNAWRMKNFDSILGKITNKYFLKNWVFKFMRAAQSPFAWDTYLHQQLWVTDSRVALPTHSFVEDRGTDWSSISQSKISVLVVRCLKEHTYLSPEDSASFECSWCEYSSYLKNLNVPNRFKLLFAFVLKSFSRF